jgi:serine phosphatase RsbU (regulator of sigma subunit)
MKRFLLIFSCIFLITGFAQSQNQKTFALYLGDTINVIDLNSLKQGRWIIFGKDRKEIEYSEYNENQIIEEGFYQNNNPIGIWKTYHPNSKIQSEIVYKPHEIKQYAKFYNAEGYLIAEGDIQQREFVGDYFIFDTNGNKFKKLAAKANSYAQLVFSGKVELYSRRLADVTVSVFRNGFKVKEFKNNSEDGSFQLNLELNFNYSIFFSKENYTTQYVYINTDVYNIADTNVYQLNNWQVKFSDNITKALGTDIAKSWGSSFISLLLNKPAGKVYFNKQKRKFTSDGKYRTFINKQVKGIKNSSKFLLNQVAIDNKRLELENLKIESEKKMNEIIVLRQTQELKEAEIRKKEAEILAQQLEKEKSNQALAMIEQDKKIKELKYEQQKAELAKKQLEAEKNAKELEHLAILKKMQDYELREKQIKLNETNESLELSVAENRKRQVELDLANREKEIKEHELKQKMLYFYVLIIGFLLILFFAFFVYRNLQQKKKANALLEKQAEEINQQKHEIEQKSLLLEQKNIETEQSIQYAKRIQHAILPPHSEISKYLKDYFILYKSKDIVSGDFYFFSDKHANDGVIHIASVDCTGHGVPGAFMSVIGHEKLSDAVSQTKEPSKILTELNKGVRTALRQSSEDSSSRDGMDLSICSLPTKMDNDEITITYAGANRPLWIARKDTSEIEEIKATKLAIGGFTEDEQEFEQHQVTLKKGDTIYLFSDGYADQFGGTKKKKLMTGKFKDIIMNVQTLSLQDQKDYLDNFIIGWMDGLEQVDDILVIGIKL